MIPDRPNWYYQGWLKRKWLARIRLKGIGVGEERIENRPYFFLASLKDMTLALFGPSEEGVSIRSSLSVISELGGSTRSKRIRFPFIVNASPLM